MRSPCAQCGSHGVWTRLSAVKHERKKIVMQWLCTMCRHAWTTETDRPDPYLSIGVDQTSRPLTPCFPRLDPANSSLLPRGPLGLPRTAPCTRMTCRCVAQERCSSKTRPRACSWGHVRRTWEVRRECRSIGTLGTSRISSHTPRGLRFRSVRPTTLGVYGRGLRGHRPLLCRRVASGNSNTGGMIAPGCATRAAR
jgi:hypothetical protein